MQDRKFKVAIARFPYGGSGGTAMELPHIGDWMVATDRYARTDPRIESIVYVKYSDTPITMTRSKAVTDARKHGIDVLIFVDSDQVPDSEPDGKPFFQTSFDFFCQHYSHGPCIIGAPYCGPPPHENVYVFKWGNFESQDPDQRWRLEQYDREHAAVMTGIQEVAALPTGLILMDMRAFDLIEPEDDTEESFFYYAYENKYCDEKAGTEDVMFSRDISLATMNAYGYNGVYCNWDAWAGHMKPKIVRKPMVTHAMNVHKKYARVVLNPPQPTFDSGVAFVSADAQRMAGKGIKPRPKRAR